jgi:hypothetical protein
MTKPNAWLYAAASAVWLAVGVIGGWAGSAWHDHAEPTFAPGAQTVAKPGPMFSGMTPQYRGSGSFEVPAQAPPGAYIVGVNGRSLGCVWARRDAKGKTVSQGVNAGASQIVTVSSADVRFDLLGDCLVEKSR